MIRPFTAVLALLFAVSAATAKSLDKSSGSLVDTLLKSADLKGRKVAVGSFLDPDKRATALSRSLSEAVEVELARGAKKSGFKLLDREHTRDLVNEWKLGMLGMVDAASAVQAGKLLGVDVLCVGGYEERDGKFQARATLVDAKTGEIAGEAADAFDADDGAKELARKYLNDEQPAGGSDALKVEVWTDKDSLKLGDKMRVYAKANKDCYLTLIDVGTSGTATVIFPNNYSGSNQAKAGVIYTIPDPTAGFEFEASAPTGTEIIRAIASKEPAVDLKEAMEAYNADNPFGKVKDPPVLTRDIHVRAKKAKKGDWSEAVLKVAIQ
jgi:uncharacterized protein DUF4384